MVHVNLSRSSSPQPPASPPSTPATPTAAPDAFEKQAAAAKAAGCPFAGLAHLFGAPTQHTPIAKPEVREGDVQQASLYARVKDTAYSTLPTVKWQYGGALGGLRLMGRLYVDRMFQNSLKETFTSSEDVLPARTKVFHPFGVVGAAHFEAAENSPFTGLFQSGAPALVRLSLASDASAYTPGVAVKLFVDAQHTRNFHAIPGLDAQESHDFFAQDFTNWIPDPQQGGPKALESALSRIVPGGKNLPVDKLAQVNAQGVEPEAVVAPVRLLLRGAKHFDANTQEDFREELARTFKPGDVLFNVIGLDDKGAEIPAGRIVLTQPLVASSFGDQELHFEHNAPHQ